MADHVTKEDKGEIFKLNLHFDSKLSSQKIEVETVGLKDTGGPNTKSAPVLVVSVGGEHVYQLQLYAEIDIGNSSYKTDGKTLKIVVAKREGWQDQPSWVEKGICTTGVNCNVTDPSLVRKSIKKK